MTEPTLNRRDALKTLGSVGAAALASRFLDSQHGFRFKTNANHKSNVIIILFDTLSARHMSLYGYHRKTTPNIENFAKSATNFRRHYSASNFTQSATASILTGVYPWSHRSLDFFEPLLEPYTTQNIFNEVASSYQTLAYTHNIRVMNILDQFKADIELLKPVEDLLVLKTNQIENIVSDDRVIGEYAAIRWLESFSLPSYSLFLNPLFMASSAVLSTRLNKENQRSYPLGLSGWDGYLFRMEDAIDWIIEATATANSPFFGYFHLLPPHEEYKPRAEFCNLFADDQFRLPVKPEHFFSEGISEESQVINCQRYDEYIAHVDAEFGRLVDGMEARGILDDSYLILTSDHGQLLERGIHGHIGPALYESVIHIPLVIRGPGQTEAVNIESATSSLDLVPTILQVTGYSASKRLEGRALPTLGGQADNNRTLYSMHARRNAKTAPMTTVTFAAIKWPYKLISYLGYSGLDDFDELFDLESDPEELRNLAKEKPLVVDTLKEELRNSQKSAEERSLNGRKTE